MIRRRLHAARVFVGDVPLDAGQSRHAREVLRLTEGAIVEVFDDDGAAASGTLVLHGSRDALVRVERLNPPTASNLRLVIASAVPKGERADWMIEKLSELGVAAFIPLAAERSVVLPEGKNKRERWTRIATESAKQSRRPGVMRIDELTPLVTALRDRLAGAAATGIVLSTDVAAPPLARLAAEVTGELIVFVGPEGGWTTAELDAFAAAGVSPARLTRTVLRIETAAVAAAAVVACGGPDQV